MQEYLQEAVKNWKLKPHGMGGSLNFPAFYSGPWSICQTDTFLHIGRTTLFSTEFALHLSGKRLVVEVFNAVSVISQDSARVEEWQIFSSRYNKMHHP